MGMNLSWKSDLQSAYKNSTDLFQFLGWEPSSLLVEKKYPLFVPQSLARKIKLQGKDGVLAREFLPDHHELNEAGMNDPIGDKEHYKAPQLIHRYHSRALFTPTSICPVHCRYCFRKNELNATDELFSPDFDKTLEYLKNHPEISEMIFTGGDPLTLSNEKMEKYLTAFSEIKSIQDIRFHTRYPVIVPSRLDDGLQQLLQSFSKKFRTISLAIHANHVDEFDQESTQKIKELSKLDIQLLSQTVLLKNVNDNKEALLELINLFISLKVRPYYLHHPDQVKGGMHFYLTLEEGRTLYAKLRSELPGWAIPQYVIDIPGGPGKVGAFNPETIAFSGKLLGRDGEKVSVQEPDLFSL
jgi:lysine 2,3-aminomutase